MFVWILSIFDLVKQWFERTLEDKNSFNMTVEQTKIHKDMNDYLEWEKKLKIKKILPYDSKIQDITYKDSKH